MSTSDQSAYDMCIAAHPTVAGRIYIGGAAVGHLHRVERRHLPLRDDGAPGHADDDRRGHARRRPRAAGRPVRRPGSRPSAPCGPAATAACSGPTPTAIRAHFVSRNDGLAVLAARITSPTIRRTRASWSPVSRTTAPAVRTGDGVWRQRSWATAVASSTTRSARTGTSASTRPRRGRAATTVRSPRSSGATRGEAGKMKTSEARRGGLVAVLLGLRRGVARRRHAPRARHRPGLVLARLGPLVGHPADGDRSARRRQPRPGPGRAARRSARRVTYATRSGPPTVLDHLCRNRDQRIRDHHGPKFAAAPNDAGGNLVLRVLALYPSGLVLVHRHARARRRPEPFAWTPLPICPAVDQRSDRGERGRDRRPERATRWRSCPRRKSSATCSCTTRPGERWGRATSRPPASPTSSAVGRRPARHAVVLRRHRQVDPDRPEDHASERDVGRPPDHRARTGVVVDPGDRNTVYVGDERRCGQGQAHHRRDRRPRRHTPGPGRSSSTACPRPPCRTCRSAASGLKLLRAATQSRGVWETDLANPSPRRCPTCGCTAPTRGGCCPRRRAGRCWPATTARSSSTTAPTSSWTPPARSAPSRRRSPSC